MLHFISRCEKNTINFAYKLASKLSKSDIVLLCGELGSGKTKFVQGILKYYGLEKEISSPTFTIINEYTCPKINIYHFDLYRLSTIEEFYSIGGEEYFDNGLCLIEWGEKIETIIPTNYIKIIFKKDIQNENYRNLVFETFGNKTFHEKFSILDFKNTQ